jgi:RHS repeat-associated protein
MRLVTDENGNTVGRHDYLPFGEEIAANAGGRDSTFGTQDFVNQKFTGKERDAETGLDFFHARYFSAALGRFNSPDPENAGANLFDLQRGWDWLISHMSGAASDWLGTPYSNSEPMTQGFIYAPYPDWSSGPSAGSLKFGLATIGGDGIVGVGNSGGGGGAPAEQQATTTPPRSTALAPGKPADNRAEKENARMQCVNGLLLQATLRGAASFVGLPPAEPSFGDLASLVKNTTNSPAFEVAAVYTATNVAKRVMTKQVASRFAAKVGSTFIPGVGEVAGAIIVGQGVWDGFSWYKEQIDEGVCDVP